MCAFALVADELPTANGCRCWHVPGKELVHAPACCLTSSATSAPQGRVTDHRVGVTEHGIEEVLAGQRLDPFIEALQLQHQSELLANLGEQ